MRRGVRPREFSRRQGRGGGGAQARDFGAVDQRQGSAAAAVEQGDETLHGRQASGRVRGVQADQLGAVDRRGLQASGHRDEVAEHIGQRRDDTVRASTAPLRWRAWRGP
jgi:hypothetical protein